MTQIFHLKQDSESQETKSARHLLSIIRCPYHSCLSKQPFTQEWGRKHYLCCLHSSILHFFLSFAHLSLTIKTTKVRYQRQTEQQRVFLQTSWTGFFTRTKWFRWCKPSSACGALLQLWFDLKSNTMPGVSKVIHQQWFWLSTLVNLLYFYA